MVFKYELNTYPLKLWFQKATLSECIFWILPEEREGQKTMIPIV